jgi:GNAT superfamily N-acetyltransferase
MTVTIRPGHLLDHTALLVMLDRMYTEPEIPPAQVNWFRVSAMITNLLQQGMVVVAEKEGQLLGSIAGSVHGNWYSDQPTLSDVWFYVFPEHRGTGAALKLLRAFKAMGEERNLRISVGHVLGMDPERMDKLYQKLGFVRMGSIFGLSPVHKE